MNQSPDMDVRRSPSISGIVLAAGASTRLGQPKQLLDVGGRPMLQRVIDVATEGSLDEIIVILGHEAETIRSRIELPPKGRVVLNPLYLSGVASSLRAGLSAADDGSEAAVILLGDQPELPASSISTIVGRFRSTGSDLIRTMWNGTPGHPVLIGRRHWDAIRRLEGDVGARDLMAVSDHISIETEHVPIADIDTWEQYRRLQGIPDATSG